METSPTRLLELATAKPLGLRRQLLLASYWFSLSFQGGALLGIAVPAQVLGLTSSEHKALSLGLVGGSATIGTMVIQPIVGALSDLNTTRWGRRLPYLIAGALVDILGLLIMAISSSLLLLFAGFLLASLGSGAAGAAYQAYVPDQVPQEQYGEASGYIGAMTMLGTVASFGASAVLVSPGDARPFFFATIAVVAVGTTFIALSVHDTSGSEGESPAVPSWMSVWLAPWHHQDFVLVFVTRGMMMLALYTLFTFVEYYVRDVLKVTQFVQGAAVVAGLATLSAVVGGVLTGWLSDRIGRKAIVSVAGIFMAALLTILAFVHIWTIVLVVGVGFGIALGAFSAVDWALAIDVLPDRRFIAKDLGLWGISTNLPQVVAPLVGGVVLTVLAPFGETFGFAVLFLWAALCAGMSSVLVWRLQTVR